MKPLLHLLALALAGITAVGASTPVVMPSGEMALPETCYVFAYFYHDREGEGRRLAWSRGGYAFEMLNGGESCLRR